MSDLFTFVGDTPDSLTGDMPAVDIVPYSSTDRLLNIATGQRAGASTPVTAVDEASIERFDNQGSALGWPRTDLLNTDDADVLALVNAVISRQAFDYLGISSLDLNADQRPSVLFYWLAYFAEAGLEDRAQFFVRKVHPSGLTFNATVRLIGQHHTITMEGEAALWESTLRTATVSAHALETEEA